MPWVMVGNLLLISAIIIHMHKSTWVIMRVISYVILAYFTVFLQESIQNKYQIGYGTGIRNIWIGQTTYESRIPLQIKTEVSLFSLFHKHIYSIISYWAQCQGGICAWCMLEKFWHTLKELGLFAKSKHQKEFYSGVLWLADLEKMKRKSWYSLSAQSSAEDTWQASSLAWFFTSNSQTALHFCATSQGMLMPMN